MKRVIENVTQKLSESEQTDQIKIGLIKYETRKSAITNSKKTAKSQSLKEVKLKLLKEVKENQKKN